MVLFIIGIIVVGVAILYGFIKAVNAIFNPLIKKMERKTARLEKRDNPYVQAHILKNRNDEMYEEYLDWLDKSGGDLPFEKWKTAEEQAFDQRVKNAGNKTRPGGGIRFN